LLGCSSAPSAICLYSLVYRTGWNYHTVNHRRE
jgi:hypothetical protein